MFRLVETGRLYATESRMCAAERAYVGKRLGRPRVVGMHYRDRGYGGWQGAYYAIETQWADDLDDPRRVVLFTTREYNTEGKPQVTAFPCTCGHTFSSRWEREDHWSTAAPGEPHGEPARKGPPRAETGFKGAVTLRHPAEHAVVNLADGSYLVISGDGSVERRKGTKGTGSVTP